MAESIKLKVEVDGSESIKSLGALEKKVGDLKNEIKGVEVGSKEFNNLANEIRKTESEVKNLNKSFEGLDNDALTGEFGKLAGGITAAATGIASLGGEANESVEKLIGTVAKGMAIAQGFKGATEALTAAQRVYNAVLKANPISPIIIAFAVFIGIIVALISQGDKIKNMLDSWAEKFTFLKKPIEVIKNIIDGLTAAWQWLQKAVMGQDKFEEMIAEKAEKRHAKAEVKRLDRLLKRSKAEGANAAEILAWETQLIENKKKLHEKFSEDWEALEDERIEKQRIYTEKHNAEEKARYDEWKALQLQKFKDEIETQRELDDLNALIEQNDIERVKYMLLREDERIQKAKEVAEKRLEIEKKYLTDLKTMMEEWKEEDEAVEDSPEVARMRAVLAILMGIQEEKNLLSDENYQIELDALNMARDEQIITEKEYLDRVKALYTKYYGEMTQKQKNFAEWSAMNDEERAWFVIETLSGMFGQAAALFEEHTAAYKILSTAQVVMDAASAIMKTWNAYSGIPVAGPILAGLQTAIIAATAVSQIAKINGVQFGDGGVLVGPKHAQGGIITPYGEVEGGEGVINANSMSNASLRNLASIANTAGGGRDFSTGDGSVKLSTESISMIVGGINDKKVFVSETDITETQKRVSLIEENSVL